MVEPLRFEPDPSENLIFPCLDSQSRRCLRNCRACRGQQDLFDEARSFHAGGVNEMVEGVVAELPERKWFQRRSFCPGPIPENRR